jgi:hypothetical protein
VSLVGFIKYVQLAYFAKPAAERCLYRAARRHRVAKILEIGVGDVRRAARLVQLASHIVSDDATICYTGIDLFEASPNRAKLPLKTAHQRLVGTGAKIKLIPGTPFDALAQTANSHLQTDMVIIAADVDQQSLGRAWFYIPRMLHDNTVVFHERTDAKTGETSYQRLSPVDIKSLIETVEQQRAA